MQSSSWITQNISIFNYKTIFPVKMKDNDILELAGNFMMFRSRREALDDFERELNELSIKTIKDEMKQTPHLKWSDEHATVWKMIQSKLAIILFPVFVYTMIPIYKYTMIYYLSKAKKEFPEYWI